MPQDNTLGAPTEGLGQTVTFAFNAGSGVPQMSLDGPGQINAGIRGTGAVNPGGTQGVAVQAAPNPTMDAILKIAEPILKTHMERKKTEAFVIGMQRAMAGEAVADIAAEQPWYSKLFGDSDVVEGARAYAGQTVAQTTVAAMEDKMVELRKLDPMAAQQYFIDSVNQNLTGDKAADAAILQAMTRALPGVMRRQAKEHYGWQQEVATERETAAFRAGAERLQSAAKGLATGKYNEDEFKGLTDQFVRSVMPANGRDPDSYKKSMADNLTLWAKTGQLHALGALRERGFFEVLDPDQLARVEQAIDAGENKVRVDYTERWAADLAQLDFEAANPAAGDTPQQLQARIAAINDTYRKETGSRDGIITPSHTVALMSRSGNEIHQERVRQAKELQKGGNETMAYELALANGSLGDLVKTPGFSVEKADAIVVSKLMSPEVPKEQRNAALVRLMGSQYVSPRIKGHLSGSVQNALVLAGNEGFTPRVQSAFDDYLALYQTSPNTAAAYYEGAGNLHARLEGFGDAVVNRGEDPVLAFNRYMTGPVSPKRLDAKGGKEAVKQLISKHNGWRHLWMGDNALKPGQADALLREIEHEAASFYGTTGDLDGSVERALTVRMSKGLEVMGGYVFSSMPGQTSVANYLSGVAANAKRAPGEENVPTDKLNEAFSDAVEALVYGDKDAGVQGVAEDANNIHVVRYPDTKEGVPQFRVLADYQGKVISQFFTADEIHKLATKRRKATAGMTGLERMTGQRYQDTKPVPPMKDRQSPALGDGLLGRMLNE